jgi:hypothetical protein
MLKFFTTEHFMMQQEVSVFDFDPVEGAISHRRSVAHIPKSQYGGTMFDDTFACSATLYL